MSAIGESSNYLRRLPKVMTDDSNSFPWAWGWAAGKAATGVKIPLHAFGALNKNGISGEHSVLRSSPINSASSLSRLPLIKSE
jgi:hypothetical protein